MTEKEKAKAYDEAIERAKKLYDNGITEEIFPELNEDKDEKIKNAILNHLKKMWGNCQDDICGIHVEDAIAWLERQGKKSSWKPSKEEMDALYSLSYITNEYDEHKEDVITHLYQDLKREFFNDSSYENMFSLDNKEDDVRRRSTIQVLEYVRSLDAYNQYGKVDIDKNIAWLEKQGKNSTDKTKPSFKVGDWIITPKNKVLQITSIDDTSYCDEQCRFWTLEDGKDGDVLATSAGAFIYNGNNGGGSCPGSYCGINTLGNFQMGVEHHWTGKKVYPATKEQRDLLFQKIKEAGYEWDEENKELKKLEKSSFHEGDWVVRGNTIAQILDVQEQYYIGLDTNGKVFVSNRFLNSDKIHLWTIEDARDGDILACNEEILLFKSYSVLQGRISLYCWYNGQTNNFHSKEVIDILLTTTNKVCPATKEQCDALMKAMNDAGYEWDAETKTLKKLVEPKFKVGDKITNTFRKYVGASGSQVIISEITDNKYIFTDGSYIFISNQDSWELAPDKNPKFDTETLKTYNDINIGDTVYIWGSGDSTVDETTITEKYDDRGHWNLKFSNGCVGRALKNGTSSTMGMYACLVYSDKEAVRESINERIKILSNIKI